MNKKLFPDFEIYSDHEVGRKSDPDITQVLDTSSKALRSPKAFVEIKRFDPNAKWMGPRQHQLKDMTEGFMVHASINFSDHNDRDISFKQKDITASVLKKLLTNNRYNLSQFADFENLEARIEYVYSFKDLIDYGHFFESGNIIPETEFPTAAKAYKKDGSIGKTYELIKEYAGKQNLKMKWQDALKIDIETSFSDWSIDGNFRIFKNIKNKKEYIYSIKNTTMFSKVFGHFDLEDNQTYRFHFTNKLGKQGGKDVLKSIDDYWFSKKRLDEILYEGLVEDVAEGIKKISSTI